jgi:tetratricopeptide (TPR) repeat protein
MTFRILASVLALVLVPLAIASTARAQAATADEAARQHFRLGEAHYSNGSFDQAAREFEEAYRLSNRPQLLYNIFVAYRDAGDVPNAVRALREYLARVPNAENATMLRARLLAMERQLAQSGTSATTQTAPETQTTTPETTTQTTAPETTETTATSTETTTETTTETATSTSTSTSTGGGGGGDGTAGWVILGAGAALVVGGAITGGLALSSQGTLQSNCPNRECPPGYDFESEASTGRALAITTDVLVITGAAAVVGGVVLGVVLSAAGGSSAAEHASIECDGTGCRAYVTGRF